MGVIVVATDGSAAAGAALGTALHLAAATGDRLVVVTVWRALQGDYGLTYPTGAVLDDLLSAEHRHAEHVLEEARADAHRAGIEVDTRLLTGDPAERVCALASELDARLIAMGTHGYGPVLRLIVGSVSSAVIRRAPCPVLVEREQEAGTERSEAVAGRLGSSLDG